MAHHASAKKRIRRNARRFEINHSRMGRIRTSVKKVETAIDSGDQAAAKDAF
jgi:small subunit ribosomal protein S20